MLNTHQCVIDWLIRLPLLRVLDLSTLLDMPERETAWTVLELEKLGWVEGVRPSSPELDEDMLYVISAAAATRLAEMNGHLDLESVFPVAWQDVSRRLSSIEMTVGVNQFFRVLDYMLRRHGPMSLEDVRWLPLSAPPELRWWPPGVEAYGCIRYAGSYAPFFVAWDCAPAPRFHRQRRIAGWYEFWDAHEPWGRSQMPSILVVYQHDEEHDQWADAVMASADRRQMPDLPVALAFLDDIFDPGPLDSIWCRPSSWRTMPFTDRVNWWRNLPVEAEAPDVRFPEITALPKPETSLRAWANGVVKSPRGPSSGVSHANRVAAISLLTSATEKQAAEWLGHHPLLSSAELASVLRLPSERGAARVVENLGRFGVVESVEGEGDGQSRHYLTELGLRVLAARDGVPHRRYALHSNVIARIESDRRLGRLRPML